MRIPEVRRELRALAVKHNLPRLAELATELHRRPYTRRARPTAVRIDDTLRKQILTYATQRPDMPLRNIGFIFGVDGARVSEIVSGKRV